MTDATLTVGWKWVADPPDSPRSILYATKIGPVQINSQPLAIAEDRDGQCAWMLIGDPEWFYADTMPDAKAAAEIALSDDWRTP